MKNLKKMIAALVVIAMIATLMVPAFAESFSYEKEARDLYDLGLYKGTDPNNYVPNLGGKLDRQTGVVMLLRLFGQEEDALALSAEDVKAKLANFKDAADIADWAQKQVAYAVNKGFVKGYPDGTFKPTADLNGKAYSSLILQQLGYDGDFEYNSAALYLKEVGGLTEAQGATFNTDSGIIRDALVGISSGAMLAKYKGSEQTVAEKLVELNKVDKTLALTKGYVFKKVKEVAKLDDVRVAIGGTPVFPEKVKVTYEDDTTEELAVTWPTTVDTSAAGEKEIEGKVAKTKASVAKVKLIVEEDKLKAVKITATNLKEIVVEFNKSVEEKSAENKSNYELDEETLADDDKIELNDDGKSVKITFKTPLNNHDEIELVIDSVKDASGTEMKEASTLKTKVSDTTFPVVEEIVLTGPDTFKLKFSEPIDASEGGDVEFDDDVYNVTFSDESEGNEIICTLGTDDIDEGDYEVKVENFKDFAGYMVADKTFKLKYAIDKSDIKAEIKEADQEKVVIKFNKGIKDEDGDPLTRQFFYHTFEDNMPDVDKVVNGKDVKGVKWNDDFTEVTLLFADEPLHEGTVKVVVKDEAEVSGDDVKVEDVWGNELKADIVLSAKVSADNTKPTVTEIDTDDDEKELKIYFSEDVDEDDAEDEDNYKFTNSKDEEVSPDSIEYTKDSDDEEYYVLVKFDDDLSGDYTVEIKNIKDTSLSENAIDTVTRKFNVKDITAIETGKVKVWAEDNDEADDTNRDYIYVFYPEDMNTDSILDKDNYMMVVDGEVKELDDKDKVELFNNKKSKVKITINNKKTYDLDNDDPAVADKDHELQIGKVKDAAGNAIKGLSFVVEIKPDIAPAVKAGSVKTVDSNKIELKIDKIISTIKKEEITVVKAVYGGNTTAQPAKVTTEVDEDDNETKVTITLTSSQKLDTPADHAYTIEIGDEAFKSETGIYMNDVDVAVADGYGPALDKIDEDVDGIVIVMTLDEDLGVAKTDLDLFATELKIVDKDGDTLKGNIDYYLDYVTGKKIAITLKGDDYAKANDEYDGKLKISLPANSDYAKDADGNGLRKFDVKTVEVNN